MPIVAGDIQYRLSGGAANADPNLSLGGAESSVAAGANIFDDVPSAESVPGDVEYRCVYIHNAHATLTMQNTKVWLQSNTVSADTTIDIGLGTAAIGAQEQSVANESTAPAGVAFSAAPDEANALSIGDIGPGQYKAVWLRRTVAAAASASNDTATLRTKCDTAA